jgi:hypothetical protein
MADLTTLRRVLLGLKVPSDFLRQYPSLGVKVREALQVADPSTRPSS